MGENRKEKVERMSCLKINRYKIHLRLVVKAALKSNLEAISCCQGGIVLSVTWVIFRSINTLVMALYAPRRVSANPQAHTTTRHNNLYKVKSFLTQRHGKLVQRH